MKRVALSALSALLLAATPAGARQQLDAHFIDDRVMVDAPLTGGGHIRFWTDTGGGGSILTVDAVKRLGFPVQQQPMPPGEAGKLTRLRDPLPIATGTMPSPPTPIMVFPDELARILGSASDSDGLLGNNWFAGHVWTWDYPRGTLTLEDDDWAPRARDHVIPATFKPPAPRQAVAHFPRIVVEIAGEKVSMLLDTGATTVLTPAVAAQLGGPRLRATSMMVASRIAAWRKAHPRWRVIEQAQSGTKARMIEVPDVRIAGISVGPVWFTERADVNFHEMMSSDTDAPVDGAIGGNAFHSLRMTVDYLRGRAAFRRD